MQLKEDGEPKYMKTHAGAVDGLLDYVFPVGRVLETLDINFDPNVTYGGSWNRIKGKTLIGVDENDPDFATAGKTGGVKAHTLTQAEMPNHTHTATRITIGSNSASYKVGNPENPGGGQVGIQNMPTSASGNGQAHNNMPPYITVYIWQRTA